MKFVPAKRRLQTQVLSQAMAKLKRRKKMRVLCLPGKEAWDFDFFAKYKRVSEVIGLEIRPKIVEGLQGWNGGKFEVIGKLTSDYLVDENKPFDLIYLDYMSNMSLVVAFDVNTILRQKLVRPGGFLIINIFGSRAGIASTCAGKAAYRSFCEVLGVQAETGMAYNRHVRLALNSLIGIHHLVPVSPKDHHVKTSIPSWKAYQVHSGSMFTVTVQVRGYPSTDQEEALRRHQSQWLLSGEHRICERVQEDRSGQ